MAGLLGAVTANPMMARQFATARQNMTAPTSVMDERYPAWKKSQDQATQFLLAADLIGSAVPAGLLAAPAMKKGLLSMGETVAPKMENYMARQGLLQPITAYHGSPHRFDKFDASKIGTGEGAQAYGHGVYFAESPVVAKSYQRMGGVELRDKAGASIPVRDELQWVAKDLAAANGDYSAVRKQLAEHGKNYPWPAEVGTKFINEMEAIGAKPFDKGSLYTVDLPDPMIAKMLDWDKPLSQQPENVKKFFASQGYQVEKFMNGDKLHSAASRYLGSKEARKMAYEDIYFARDLSDARKAWNKGPAALEEYMNTGDGSWLRGVLTRSKDGNKSGGAAYRELADRLGGFGQANYQGGGQVAASDSLRTGGESLLGMSDGLRRFPAGGASSNTSQNFNLLQVPGIRYLDGGSRGAGAGTSNFVVFPGNEQLVKILSRE